MSSASPESQPPSPTTETLATEKASEDEGPVRDEAEQTSTPPSPTWSEIGEELQELQELIQTWSLTFATDNPSIARLFPNAAQAIPSLPPLERLALTEIEVESTEDRSGDEQAVQENPTQVIQSWLASLEPFQREHITSHFTKRHDRIADFYESARFCELMDIRDAIKLQVKRNGLSAHNQMITLDLQGRRRLLQLPDAELLKMFPDVEEFRKQTEEVEQEVAENNQEVRTLNNRLSFRLRVLERMAELARYEQRRLEGVYRFLLVLGVQIKEEDRLRVKTLPGSWEYDIVDLQPWWPSFKYDLQNKFGRDEL